MNTVTSQGSGRYPAPSTRLRPVTLIVFGMSAIDIVSPLEVNESQLPEMTRYPWLPSSQESFYTTALPVPPPPPPADMADLQQLVRGLHMYYMPSVACVGLLANLISVAIMVQPAYRGLSTAQYVLTLLLADSLRLGCVLHDWLALTRQIHVYFVGGWCQFTVFCRGVADFLAVWVISALALDRLLAIRYPLSARVARLGTPCAARLVSAGLLLIATIVNLNTSLLWALLYYGATPICTAIPAFSATVRLLDHADVILNGLLPYGCTMVALGAILIQLALERRHRLWVLSQLRRRTRTPAGRARRARADSEDPSPTVATSGIAGTPGTRASSVSNSNVSEAAEENSASKGQTRMSLVLVLAFLVLTLPYQAFRLQEAVLSMASPQRQQTLHSFLIQEILLHIRYTKLTFNFILIFASYESFRRKFFRGLLFGISRRLHSARYSQRQSGMTEASSASLRTMACNMYKQSNQLTGSAI